MKKIKSKSKRRKRIKILKSISIIPLIIILLIANKSVNAGTQDSTLSRTTIDGVYAVAPLSDATHLYNLETYQINNRAVYCIEIGTKVTTSLYSSTSTLSEIRNITGLTTEQLNYINLIAYFGYKYSTHSDYKYYMAAQELIWEYLNDIDVTWTNVLDINGEKINIDSYKNEITTLIKAFNSNLSFSTNINCKVGDTIILTDTNNSLQYYSVTSKGNGNHTITKSGNTLTIEVSNNYIGTDKIILTRQSYYNNITTLYYYEDSQKLLSTGRPGGSSRTITLNIEGETLTTNLIDYDTKTNTPSGQATLAGAVYELYDKDNNLITTFTTDESGINTIDNLYHDTYYIKQIKASTGYKLNEEIIEINITSDNNKQTLTEEVIKSTIEINKLYEIEDTYQREENISFSIYDNQNNLYTTITTTKYGPDKVTLPYGIYTIKQDNTTYGYDTVQDITLSIDENADTIIRYDLVDKKITTKLHITTKDKTTVTNIKESNIQYKIKDTSTNEYLTYTDSNNTKVDVFYTNKNGELTIPIKLPYGTYIIEQITTPTKYLENTDTLKVTINENSEYLYIDDEVVVNVNFYNIPITGKITITTTEEVFIPEENDFTTITEIRPNIEVELYYEDELQNTYTTDEKGELVIDNLPLGNYCIKETASDNQKCLEITNTDNTTPVIEKEVNLHIQLNKVTVTLTNQDPSSTPIEGTTIELYQDDNLINTSITNENGKIKIPNLPTGKYCFKETKISSQYILNEEKLCFEVKDNSKNIDLTIINDLAVNEIPVPHTSSNKKSYSIIIISIILLSIIIIFFNRRHH